MGLSHRFGSFYPCGGVNSSVYVCHKQKPVSMKSRDDELDTQVVGSRLGWIVFVRQLADVPMTMISSILWLGGGVGGGKLSRKDLFDLRA